MAAACAADDVIVVLLPDGGRGYLSKIFNDDWMAEYGFLAAQTSEPTVADVMIAVEGVDAFSHGGEGGGAGGAGGAGMGLPSLVHVHPEETVAAAVALLREYDVSQLPVVRQEPPLMAAEVAGSVAERDLLDALLAGKAKPQDRVGDHMSPPLPLIGSGEPVTAAATALEKLRGGARPRGGQARRYPRPGRTCLLSTRAGGYRSWTDLASRHWRFTRAASPTPRPAR